MNKLTLNCTSRSDDEHMMRIIQGKALFSLSLLALTCLIAAGMAQDAPLDNQFESMFKGGKVPFPYTSLMNSIIRKNSIRAVGRSFDDPSGSAARSLETSRIPDGRSLVRKYATFSAPRYVSVITSFTRSIEFNGNPNDLHFEGTPPTFIGYAPLSNELEVISWNPAARKYDFLLVTGYRKGGSPKIEKVDENICLACHQHGGPIFPRNGWSEAGGDSSPEFVAKIGLGPKVPGIAPDNNNTNEIDSLVRTANDQLQANRVCSAGCGDDTECREKLLLGALARAHLKADPTKRKSLASALSQAVRPSWPKDEFTYVSDVLPNRDPSSLPDHRGRVSRVRIRDLQKVLNPTSPLGTTTALPPLVQYRIESEYRAGIEFTYNHDNAQVDGLSDEFKRIEFPYDDPSSLGDPTMKRPKVSAIPVSLAGEFLIDHVTDCFNLSDKDEAFLKNVPYEKLEKIVDDPITEVFVRNWPPDRERIMTYIRARISGAPVANDILCPKHLLPTTPLDDEISKSAKAIALRVPPKGAFEAFQVYCGRCHDGPNALVEDFGIETVADLKNFKPMMGGTLAERITDGNMPADLRSYSESKKQDWERDKKLILQELEK